MLLGCKATTTNNKKTIIGGWWWCCVRRKGGTCGVLYKPLHYKTQLDSTTLVQVHPDASTQTTPHPSPQVVDPAAARYRVEAPPCGRWAHRQMGLPSKCCRAPEYPRRLAVVQGAARRGGGRGKLAGNQLVCPQWWRDARCNPGIQQQAASTCTFLDSQHVSKAAGGRYSQVSQPR